MKKILITLMVISVLLVSAGFVVARPSGNGNQVDEWGYNYQANMFNGWYWNNQRPDPAYTKDTIGEAPSETQLIMKWSDEWMTTKCGLTDEGKAKRGCDKDCVCTGSSGVVGAWLTNHQWGSYEQDEKTCKWQYFVKIAHPGDDAYKDSGMWYTDDTKETEIGTVLWGAYARILQISNDKCADEHGVLNNWEAPTGFGFYN